ncbi:MAG: hypothetical protein KAT71_08400 [Gammaproteobacteria bacterium]|nr:hypothetical protein [Gammaproteobacteria bacterium]
MSKEIPERLKLNDMSVVLRIQNAMCVHEGNRLKCAEIDCEDCVLDAPLPEFKAWLVKTLEGIE